MQGGSVATNTIVRTRLTARKPRSGFSRIKQRTNLRRTSVYHASWNILVLSIVISACYPLRWEQSIHITGWGHKCLVLCTPAFQRFLLLSFSSPSDTTLKPSPCCPVILINMSGPEGKRKDTVGFKSRRAKKARFKDIDDRVTSGQAGASHSVDVETVNMYTSIKGRLGHTFQRKKVSTNPAELLFKKPDVEPYDDGPATFDSIFDTGSPQQERQATESTFDEPSGKKRERGDLLSIVCNNFFLFLGGF